MIFKVGDLITQRNDIPLGDQYGITNNKSVCEILSICPDSGEAYVSVLDHKDPDKQEFIGDKYRIDLETFKVIMTPEGIPTDSVTSDEELEGLML